MIVPIVLWTAKSTEIESLSEQVAVLEEEKRQSVQNEVVKSSVDDMAKDEEVEQITQKLSGL